MESGYNLNESIAPKSSGRAVRDFGVDQYHKIVADNASKRRLVKSLLVLYFFQRLRKEGLSEEVTPRAGFLDTSLLLWVQGVLSTVLILGCAIHPVVVALIYAGLAIWSLRGARQAIEALSLSFLITFLNPYVFHVVGISNSFRWVVFIFACFRIFLDSARQNVTIPRELGLLVLYAAAVLTLSVISSYELSFSLSKLIIFTIGVGAVILAFNLTSGYVEYWKSWFFTLYLVILVLSIPTYFIPSIGRHLNGSFQGILNHPQSFGVFACPIVAWLSGMYIFEKKKSHVLILGIILGWAAMFASQARTAILSVLTGFFLLIIIGLVKRRDWRELLLQTILSKFSLIAISLIGFMVLLNWSVIVRSWETFLQKGRADLSIAQSIEISRGSKIQESLNNFQEHPWTGIGFGVMSEVSGFKIERSAAFNIAIGATYEKSFLPSAVLEETGIIGAIFFLIFLAFLPGPLFKDGSLPGVWLFLVCIIVNMGEMMFFSFGGMGLFMWLLIALSRMMKAEKELQPMEVFHKYKSQDGHHLWRV